jgi:hypothetical protein
LRGLALYASDDLDLQVLGDNFLASRVPGDSKEEQRRIDYWLRYKASRAIKTCAGCSPEPTPTCPRGKACSTSAICERAPGGWWD